MDSIPSHKQSSSANKPKTKKQGELKGKSVQSEKKLSSQSIAAKEGWELAPKTKIDEKSVIDEKFVLSSADLSSDSENLKLARAGKNGIKIRVETAEDIGILRDFISDPYNTFFLRRLEVIQVGDINEGNIEAVQGLLDELGKNGEYLNRLSLFSCGRIDIDRDPTDFSNKFLFLKDLPNITYFSFGKVINPIILGTLEKLQVETHRPPSPFEDKDISSQIKKHLGDKQDFKDARILTRASAALNLSDRLVVLSCDDLVSLSEKMKFAQEGHNVKIKIDETGVLSLINFIDDPRNKEFLKFIEIIEVIGVGDVIHFSRKGYIQDIASIQSLLNQLGEKGAYLEKLSSLCFGCITLSNDGGILDFSSLETIDSLRMISCKKIESDVRRSRNVFFKFPERLDKHIDFSCQNIQYNVSLSCSGISLRSFSCSLFGEIRFLGESKLDALFLRKIGPASNFIFEQDCHLTSFIYGVVLNGCTPEQLKMIETVQAGIAARKKKS